MKLSKTGWAAVAAIVLLLIVGGAYFRGTWSCEDGTWKKIGHPLSSMPQEFCPEKPKVATPPRQICSPPWSCGRLAQGETGMKRDTWYLKYEDETGPARLEIVFLDNAVCRVDSIQADCNRLFPPNGTTSSFNGFKDGDLFRVSRLDFTLNR